MMKQHAILIGAVIASMISCREAGSAVVSKSQAPPTQGDASSNGPSGAVDTTTTGPTGPAVEATSVSTSGLPAIANEIEATLDPPPPLDFQPPGQSGLQQGWAAIVERADGAQRAWIEGTTERSDKLVIETKNVRRFNLSLPHLGVDWSKRIALRIDGSTSELTKKRWPSMTLERTPAGAWIVVD